ncbi:MAG: GspH/FimT family pseudopilin [Planctomycetales bacterium]|nr:GspH/FimT family pseudopilin [Planctomycetales bacterium]
MRRAFTLIELLVVLSILAIAGIAVAPTLTGLSARRLESSARSILAHARWARGEAALRGGRVQLVLDLDARTHVVQVEADPVGAPGTFAPARGLMGAGWPLEEDIAFFGVKVGEIGRPLGAEPESLTSGTVTLEFRPDGTATAADLFLSNPAGDGLVVRVHGVTGRSSILDPDAEALEETRW